MRILILNQAFHPDVVATGQYAADLAVALASQNHEVTVLCSARGYDDPHVRFPAKECWKGVAILRVAGTGYGKAAKWRRAADFASFLARCAWHLPILGRFDAIIALTTPPLISVLGVACKLLRGGRLVYWTMDLNPDEAIAAGWLNQSSTIARFLAALQNFTLRRSDAVITLDTFMRDRVITAGTSGAKVFVVAPWQQDDWVRYNEDGRARFRQEHDLNGRFVVMYSGNHSPCHPLDSLLEAAKSLRYRDDIVFAFVGGGSEWHRLKRASANDGLSNIRFLPYQPRERLSESLSAADLQAVVLGEKFVGIVHPSKIYNILAVGCPVLYIGPPRSHVTELLGKGGYAPGFYAVAQGTGESVAEEILRTAETRSVRRGQPSELSCSRQELLQRMTEIITGQGEGIVSGRPIPATLALDGR